MGSNRFKFIFTIRGGCMVYRTVLILLAISSVSQAKVTQKGVCDQELFDRLYKAIIQEALDSKESLATTIYNRNISIQTLRKLCKGQKATLERDGYKSVKGVKTGKR